MLSPDHRIDDYVLGRMSDDAAALFEAALAKDAVLQHTVEEVAGLIHRLNRLGQDILHEPLPDQMLRLLEVH